jgi:hypothetical protein
MRQLQSSANKFNPGTLIYISSDSRFDALIGNINAVQDEKQ